MNKHKDKSNYNVLGKFKSEVGENIITEFCSLNPKCYAYRYLVEDKTKENKKAKGISMPVVEQTMQFSDYHDVMTTTEPQSRKTYNIRPFNQQLFTALEEKQSLSPFYDKMRLLDAINCEPYGVESS